MKNSQKLWIGVEYDKMKKKNLFLKLWWTRTFKSARCTNGHLMCSGCFAHLLADARLKNESGTCPNCRCEISKIQCSRNLAVEKAVAELPSECQFCNENFPRNVLERHIRECPERCVPCKFARIGCAWLGPFHELTSHEAECPHPRKSGSDVMEALEKMDSKDGEGKKVFENLLELLSFEKINFQDLQLRPYRTDDFITRLYYETSRFTALQNQWVVKARVNDNQKDPSLACNRFLSYQLCLKSKITAPLEVQYVVLCGPYGEFKLQTPSIYRFSFDAETTETDYCTLHLPSSTECNKLLSAKTINFRLIIFQVQKWIVSS